MDLAFFVVVFGCARTACGAKMESCRIRTFSAGKTVCKVAVWIKSLEAISSIVIYLPLDLKRVIYEVFCHVIRGNLRHDDAISLLSDVTVSSDNE